MKPHENFNPGPAELGLNHGAAGKGSKERCSKWRAHFDEIKWSGFVVGMERKGRKMVKKYAI